MSRNAHKLILILALLFVIIGGIWFETNFTFNISNQHEQNLDALIKETIVPEGWYRHSLGKSTILIREVQLPDIRATEPYAYGDHILISTGIFDGTFENIEAWNRVGWVFEDEALVRYWTKTKIIEYDALRVEHRAAGASGEHITYFLFSENKFYSTSLYSQDISLYLDEFEKFVLEYANSLAN
ncbi:MAG: hypothetical protein WDZ88_00100 [Candidatus Paceibacterota bacterium]